VSNYYSIITERGLEKLTLSKANGKAVRLKTIAIGDAAGNDDALPAANQSALIREVYRAEINRLFQHEQDANILVAELHIPSNVGGFIIREAGIFDEDGELFAVGRYPATVKPNLSDGISREEIVQLAIAHSNNSQIELKIDPSIVMASRAYVDTRILESHREDHEDRTIIHVGADGDFPDLQSAWDSVRGKRIAAPLVFKLKKGVHTINKGIYLSHPPIGNNIYIEGEISNPDDVSITANYAESTDIICVDGVPALHINGLTIKGNDYQKIGLRVTQSNVISSSSLKTVKTRIGICAQFNSSFISNNSEARDTDRGMYADYNSTLYLNIPTVSCLKKEGNARGTSGVECSVNSCANIVNGTISNATHGTYAVNMSSLLVSGTSIEKCALGLSANNNGYINSNDTTISDCDYGIYAHLKSFCCLSDMFINSCTVGFSAVLGSMIRSNTPPNNIKNCPTPYNPPGHGIMGEYHSFIYRDKL